jgi:vitamin B12 transporter
MHTSPKAVAVAAACLVVASGAFAESSLPPIFITAGRVAEPVEETLYSTSTVTREEIERQLPRDVGEILGRLPGIQIGRNGGAGQATSAFIRGAASDQTLLLIDGVPMNSGTVGSPALQHFMTDQIGRVEVVRGPASTLYGSGAIGGVVQLLTPETPQGTTAQVAVGAGSEDSGNISGSFSHGGEQGSARLALSRRDTDGYPVRPSLSPVDRGYRNDSLDGTVGFSLGDLKIDMRYLRSEGLVEYIDFFGGAVDQDTLNSLARLAFHYAPNATWESRLLLAHVRDEIEENQSDDFAKTERDYLDWQNTLAAFDRHTLVAGITASRTDTGLLSFGGTPFESRYDEGIRSVEYYIQDTVDLGDTRLQLGGRAIDNEQYGDHYTWNLAVGHKLTEATRLHANAGTAFRAPSANDLYLSSGNPDFDPETSTSAELGVTHRVTSRDTLRLVGFRTEIEDLIETDPITFTVTQTERARITGVELGYAHRSSQWTWSLDYTYLDPKNLDVDQMLARRARNTVHAALGYQQSQWWSEARLRYQSERRDSRFSDTMLAPYTTVDIAAGYRFSPSVSVTGRIQNLFDEDYELAATYPAQGRFVGVELRYDYDSN